jgi:hypothetical protein
MAQLDTQSHVLSVKIVANPDLDLNNGGGT